MTAGNGTEDATTVAAKKAKGLRSKADRFAVDPLQELAGMTELSLVDVALITSYDGAKVEIARLGIGFDQAGMTVRKPNGDTAGVVPWPLLQQFKASAPAAQSAGARPHVALEIDSDRRHHSFSISHIDLSALNASLTVLSKRYTGRDLVAVDPKAKGKR
ncbi:MAG TPA: hypothetical protein VGS21_02685 [Acidimicrobiales bacterium]|nr:hypothetical protein [Acidimicrobiales bacterium]